jgi:DNA-binding response OmpR family regulator
MARIFVLEDDKDIREVIEWILEAEDYEVYSFDSVNEFMIRDVRNLPDLFILDVRLPDGSGIDVCHQLRKDSANSYIPILMMSAHANMQQIENGCNADGFIQKPFNMNQFLNLVRTHLGSTT